MLLVAWQAIAQQAASPPQPVVVVSASLQPNIERSCRLWPGGSVEFYSLTAMGRSGSRLPTLSDSDIERIQSLIAQLQPGASPAPPWDRDLTVTVGDRVHRYDRAHLPQAVHQILTLLDCTFIPPWVPEFPHQKQWTQSAASSLTLTLDGRDIELGPEAWRRTALDGGGQVVVAPSRRIEVYRDRNGILLRSRQGGAEIARLFPQSRDSMTVAFSPDESKVAIVREWTGRIGVWNNASGALISDLRCTPRRDVHGLLWSPGNEFLMVDLGSAIELWNIGKERLQGKLTGCLATNGIAMLDNSELIQSCQDGRVLGWNLSEVLGQIGAFHQ